MTGRRIQSPEMGPKISGSLEHSRQHLHVHGHIPGQSSEQHCHGKTAKQLEITIENHRSPANGSMNSQIIVQ